MELDVIGIGVTVRGNSLLLGRRRGRVRAVLCGSVLSLALLSLIDKMGDVASRL